MLEALRRAAELEPAYAPALADAHYNLGNHLQGQQRFSESIERYREALRIYDDRAPNSLDTREPLRNLARTRP